MTPAKKPFQVGDRVIAFACSEFSERYFCKGKIVSINWFRRTVSIQLDFTTAVKTFAFEQCRRLKKKPKAPRGKVGGREVWISNQYPGSDGTLVSVYYERPKRSPK